MRAEYSERHQLLQHPRHYSVCVLSVRFNNKITIDRELVHIRRCAESAFVRVYIFPQELLGSTKHNDKSFFVPNYETVGEGRAHH